MSLAGELLQETYRVGELLGSGGMGDVYEASHTRLNRRFAVKILHTRFAKNEEAYNRFRREAQIASSLGHPHIVEVVDFNVMANGSPYIVLEYLEGEDLEERLLRVGKLDVQTTVHIARQLGSALGAAHAKKIVHRDLKPQNVFVTTVEDDQWYTKVLDFGISKIRGSTSIVTQDKALLGTPNYMSPEQAEGKTDLVDHRTDQFALGTMVYEMISGRNPFDAESIPSIMYHVVHTTPPPLHEVAPGVSPAFSAAVARAMSKEPLDRFAGIREFVRVLRGLPASVDTGPIPVNPSKATANERRASLATAETVASTADDLAPAPSNVVPIRPDVVTTGSGTSTASPYGQTSYAADSVVEQPPARSRKPIMYLAVGALGIAAAVVSFMLVSGGGKSKSNNDVAASASNGEKKQETDTPDTPAPSAAKKDEAASDEPKQPATVTVSFRVKPTPDKIIVDGKPITGDKIDLAPDGGKHTVRFEKSGHKPMEQSFTVSEKMTLSVILDKQPRRRSSARRNKRRVRKSSRRARPRPRKTTPTKKKKTKSKFMLELD